MENTLNTSQTYLSFKVGDETYAVHTKYVISILALKPITKLPEAPAYVRGVINFRGSALPIFDMRIMLGLPEAESNMETSIVSTEIGLNDTTLKIGFLVDSLTGVFNILPEEILPSPSVSKKMKSNWIEGLVRNDETFTQMLKLDSLVSEFDQEWVQNITNTIEQ
jgi:purine-binding chemotaxis protein CheW